MEKHTKFKENWILIKLVRLIFIINLFFKFLKRDSTHLTFSPRLLDEIQFELQWEFSKHFDLFSLYL